MSLARDCRREPLRRIFPFFARGVGWYPSATHATALGARARGVPVVTATNAAAVAIGARSRGVLAVAATDATAVATAVAIGGTGGGSIVTTWLTATHTTALGAICSYCM